MFKHYKEILPRYDSTFDKVLGIECSCHGFCEEVEPTSEEEAAVGCGRSGCCNKSFLCKICGTRWAAGLLALEMSF